MIYFLHYHNYHHQGFHFLNDQILFFSFLRSGLNPVSTLSLVVTSWPPACQQALMRLDSLQASSHLRECAVMACIMAEAHEMTPTHHITAKVS